MNRSRLLIATVVLIAAASAVPIGAGPSGQPAGGSAAAQAPAKKPNFVFVLTDDLSRNLVPYMKHVEAMKKQGTSFSRYFVTDSLCCPSRSSIFTGRYPHSTGVITNGGTDGGFDVFHRREEKDTFATTLQAQHYDTAMMGKYLNGYKPRKVVDGQPKFVPPGWSAWSVAGNGYPNFNYNLLQKTVGGQPHVQHYGGADRDYLTDVISERGRGFIRASVTRGNPFMLELATFAPHGPYTPAPRDANKFPKAEAPRGPLFNRRQAPPRPQWLSQKKLSKPERAAIDGHFRKRAQAVQAVDKMIGDIQAELKRLRVADNTYIVFSSDNGYHMGQRRMGEGKQTAWDHDIRVPMVVVGPKVPANRTVDRVVANVDLRPTFQDLAGAPTNPRVEGRSLAGFLRGDRVRNWRSVTLIEHRGPNMAPSDPDKATRRQGNPPSYKALRFRDALWVQYDNPRYRSEYYNLKKDPYERHSLVRKLSAKRRGALRARVAALHRCSDQTSCHAADR